MNWDAVGAIGQVGGAIGVVVSLGYLAVQIRRNSQATRASTVHGINTSITDAWRPFSDPSNASVYIAGIGGIASLSPEERVRFFSLMHVFIKMCEDIWFQWRAGTLGDTYWEGHQTSVLDIFSQPGPREYWELRKLWFGADFREFLDARRAGHEPKDMHYVEQDLPRGVD